MQGVGWKLDEEVISMNKKKNSMTTNMDVLSDCVIEKILCFLSFKKAAQMSIISKTWLRAWLTHPNLKFTYHDLKIVDTIMERYRDGKIPIETFELWNTSGNSSPLVNKWIDIALQNGVKDLVIIGDYTVSLSIFTILASKSLRELVLEACTLMPVSSSSGVGIMTANCNSLRKLSLSFVCLDDNTLQALLNNFPMIVSIHFEYCSGLNKIDLSNLQKIKSVSIMRRYSCPVIIRAPTLEHLSFSCQLSDELDVVECQNLKSLDLSRVWISNGFLTHFISRFQSLEVLKIQDCVRIMEINSPNLVSFEYSGNKIPQLKISRELRKLKYSKIVLHCDYCFNYTIWFCELRNFLSNLTSWSQVSLYLSMYNVKDLRLHHPLATPQVDVLNVFLYHNEVYLPTLMDALLWSCHPTRLNLHSNIRIITSFIHRLSTLSSSSSSQEMEPWHSQLIEIEAFDEKNQPLQLKSGPEMAINTLTKGKEVYFLLDWQCN